jgi:uncharacterized protein YcfJ
MLRKLWISGLAVGLAAASAGALAENDRGSDRYVDDRNNRHGERDHEYAQVVDVQPIRRQVRVSVPVRECRNEVVYQSDGPFSSRHIGGTMLGGLIGGVLGNQVGDGNGRTVARVAGAVIGGAIGHNVSRDRQLGEYGNERVVERCEVRYRDNWEERIDGYDVTYEYAGRQYFTRMPYDPGERVRIRIDVTPLDG